VDVAITGFVEQAHVNGADLPLDLAPEGAPQGAPQAEGQR
jgi:hypothetical protein